MLVELAIINNNRIESIVVIDDKETQLIKQLNLQPVPQHAGVGFELINDKWVNPNNNFSEFNDALTLDDIDALLAVIADETNS
jgi:hypothetical protein